MRAVTPQPLEPHEEQRRLAYYGARLVVSLPFPPTRHLDLAARFYGTDKSNAAHGYSRLYQRHMGSRRRQVRSLLEMGIGGVTSRTGLDTRAGGQSLKMWCSYFPKAQIVGIDIHEKAVRGRRIAIEQGSQADPEFLRHVARKHGPFDIVVDDGSHVAAHVLTSFDVLWEYLAPGGIYVIEDLEHAYLSDYGGGPPGNVGHMGLIKALLDDTLRHHWDADGRARIVESVHVYDEIAFIHKSLDAADPQAAIASCKVAVPFAAPLLGEEERRAVGEVLASGWIGTGAQARQAEREFARYLDLPNTLLVNSGTAALHLALVVRGIGPGDEVIIPTITFTATAATVVHAGGVPVFVDVEPDTLNIDVRRAREAITPRTRAIVAVHMAGRMADVAALRRLCDERGLVLIEDSAHALPAAREGWGPGQAADAAAFSFFVTKPLTSAEGGLLAARDDVALERARVLSAHGIERAAGEPGRLGRSPHYDVVAAGFKYNLPDVLATLLRCQLQRADSMHGRRRAIAEAYLAGLSGLPGLELPPADRPDDESSWYLFIVRVPEGVDRDGFARRLARRGIGTSIHLRPLHQFSYYARSYPTATADVEVADAIYPRLLSLPIHAGMSNRDVSLVIEAVNAVAAETS